MTDRLAPAVRRVLRDRVGEIRHVADTVDGVATVARRVRTATGTYAVKRPSRPGDAGGVLVEGRLLARLDGGEPRTPTPVVVSGRPTLVVTEWVDGRAYGSLAPPVRERAVYELGRAVAALHRRRTFDAVGRFVPASAAATDGWPRVDATDPTERLATHLWEVLRDAPEWAVAALADPVARYGRRCSLRPAGPAVLTQGDVVGSNAVFTRTGGVECLLDFEAASAYPAACELFATAEKLRYWSPVDADSHAFADAFRGGYRAERTPERPPPGTERAYRLLGLLRAIRARRVYERNHDRRHRQLLDRFETLTAGG